MLTEIEEVLAGKRRWCVVEGDFAEVLPTLPDKSVAHLLDDPPYSEHVHAVGRIQDRYREGNESFGFDAITPRNMDDLAREAARLATRWTLIFCDMEGAENWRLALRANALPPIRQGIWVKPDAMPQLTGDRPANGAEAIVIAHPPGKKRWNGGGLPAVWTYCIERADRVHTTQKPINLLLKLVEQFTDPDEVVLDGHAGSGTTGVACFRLGRRFIGVEKDPKYAAIARERLEAESRGLTLRAARAGQTAMFSAEELTPKPKPPEPEPMSKEEAEAWDARELEAMAEADQP